MDFESFPNDAKLIGLRRQWEHLSCCRYAARKTTTEAEALALVREHMATAGNAPFTVAETVQLINRCRAARDDFSLQEELERDDFSLVLAVENRVTALRYHELFDPISALSPQPVANVGPEELFGSICPAGAGVLHCESSRGREPQIWRHEIAEQIQSFGAWYWPLPTNYTETTPPDQLIRRAEVVVQWTAASTVLQPDQIEVLPDLIATGQVRVRSVVSTDKQTASVVLAVPAGTKAEWLAACRTIKAAFSGRGVKAPNFRFDWLAHMPGAGLDNRLVYFAA